MIKKRQMNIAIIGLGNIGSYLYKYLLSNQKILSKKNNCFPNIIFVSAKNRNRKRNPKTAERGVTCYNGSPTITKVKSVLAKYTFDAKGNHLDFISV